MELSVRLRTIADMVTPGNRLADIGTDHGFLPITLIMEGKIPSAIAMDIGKGPLQRAREHVLEYNLSDKVQLRLSDGFAALGESEADTAVIAGMGGLLMVRILEAGIGTAHSLKELILSPQSDLPAFRRWVLTHGFSITAEKFVLDEDKYYTVMRVVPGGGDFTDWTEAELKYGRFLIREQNEVFLEYLKKETEKYIEIEEKLHAAGTEKALERLETVIHERRLAEQAADMR